MSDVSRRGAGRLIASAFVFFLCHPVGANGSTPVIVTTLGSVVVAPVRVVPAEVMTLNRSQVAAEVDGIVRSVAVKPGETVRAGEPIATIDVGDYELEHDRIQATIASTRARIDQARLRLKQANDLSRSQFVSSDELLARETDLRVLDAELVQHEVALASARRNIRRANVTAPFDGVVTERMAAPGAYVRRGDAVVMLTDVRNVELEASVPETLLADLGRGTGFEFEALGQKWVVAVERISPVTERDERVGKVRFGFTAPAPRVGTSGQLRWTSARGLLPSRFLTRRDGSLGVLIADGDAARFIALPGARQGRPASHELASDTLLITGGGAELGDGDAISVRDR